MKVAIYVRVSRTDQVLENQINPLVEYCKRMKWEYELFEEKESTRKSRPIQWNLYNRLLKKEFDGLLFYKLDRWARSLKELVTHMEALHEKGVILVSYMENIDLSTSSGKLMMNIMGSFAEFERSIIRERTLAGLARARAQGKKLGRPRVKRNYGDKKQGKPYKNGFTNNQKHDIRKRARAKKDKLLKEECEKCGSKEELEMHHPDYSKPLEVITLCIKCHWEVHHGKGGM